MTPKKLDALRTEIAALQAERAQILAQPRSRKAVAEELRRQWTAARSRGFERLRLDAHRAASGAAIDLLAVGANAGRVDVGPLVALLLTDAAIADLVERSVADVPEGLPEGERPIRLDEIRMALDKLEAEEERTVVHLGCERRPDARPEIILATP